MGQTAIIGLDGLSPADVQTYGFEGTWHPLQIETRAHTAPSWNAIFSGREREEIYDFFKFPEDGFDYDGQRKEMASISNEMWDYDELRTDDYLWERDDISVEVVSAPVMLPTFSTLEEPPGNDLTWCNEKQEFSRAISELTRMTKEQENVITVYPLPDKMNHMVDSPDSDYSVQERHAQMLVMRRAVEELKEEFDEWVLLSDHGRPSQGEPIEGTNLYVASHNPTGVISSNAVDTEDLTNVTVYDRLVEVLQ